MSNLDWLREAISYPDEECIDWPFALSGGRSRRPQVRINHRTVYVHRMVLEWERGPALPGQHGLHWCDRPICVNPWHLRWGTREENMQEMRDRNRTAFGSRTRASKLAEDDVRGMRVLRASGVTQRELSERYGVTQSTISVAVRGINWRHV